MRYEYKHVMLDDIKQLNKFGAEGFELLPGTPIAMPMGMCGIMIKETDPDWYRIPAEEWIEKLRDSKFLSALREAGVDNWEGYSYAVKATCGEEDED